MSSVQETERSQITSDHIRSQQQLRDREGDRTKHEGKLCVEERACERVCVSACLLLARTQ